MTVLITSYASFSSNIYGLLTIIFIVFFASLVGDILTYLLARRFSKDVKIHLGRFRWYNKHEKKTYTLLKKYEFIFVFFSRFLFSGACTIVNYLSGFEKLNFKKFAVAVFLGELVYSAGYALIGYVFKDTWMYLLTSIQYGLLSVVLLVIVSYLFYKIAKYYGNKN
ncbi:MAG: VTT domain-containing protein [Nanoarchaeota archaeon]